MAKPLSNRSVRAHEGPAPKNNRENAQREQSRGLAISRIEPSHQHSHDRKVQSMKRVKRAK